MVSETAIGFGALFPGQLSEKAGMGESLYRAFPECAAIVADLGKRSGVPFEDVFFQNASRKEAIHEDLPAQVGVFAVSLAALEALALEGLRPAAVAGYSLGTYAAFVAAGCCPAEVALEVLLEVDRCLVEEGVRGGMGFVIGLSRAALEAELTEGVFIGTANAGAQFIVTGEKEAVEALLARVSGKALKQGLLPLGWPMHAPTLAGVTEKVAKLVDRLPITAPTRAALYAPMLGRAVTSEEEARRVLAHQVSHPSLWDETLRQMAGLGIRKFVELGPGDVLTRLLRWTVRDARGLVLEDLASLRDASRELYPTIKEVTF